jgi:hypothetical protein
MTLIDTTQPAAASVASVLETLTVARIHELARDAGLAPRGRRKDELVKHVADTGRIRFRALLAQLRREELRAACREHRLPDTGRARQGDAPRPWGGRSLHVVDWVFKRNAENKVEVTCGFDEVLPESRIPTGVGSGR